MKGIHPEGRCPKCKGTFKRDKQKGFVCPGCLTHPKRYTVCIHYKGERIRRGTTLDGKTLQTFADAHGLLRQAENDIEAHRFDPARWKAKDRVDYRMSIQLDLWYHEKVDLMNKGRRAAGYVPKLKTYIEHYYKPFFGHKDVREIFNCKDFVNGLPNRLSLKYQKNISDALKGFFNWLKENRVIAEIPVFPVIEVPEHEPQTISREIQLKLLDEIPAEHRPIFTFLFYQGCRPGEVRALKWDSINDDVVTIKRTWSGRVLKETTKTKNIRHNLIFPEVMAVLPARRFPLDFVFTHGVESRRPYSQDFLNRLYRDAQDSFNLKHGTTLKTSLYESTKHSFGTQLINQGVPESLLQQWFGHTRAEMTKKYAKLRVVDAFRDLQKMRNLKDVQNQKPPVFRQ
ncbi:MAG: hypothetical protein OHK006_13950 [Thermodesulfovibrionales bacterium]